MRREHGEGPADFIEQYQGAIAGVMQDFGGFGNFHHERGLAGGEIVDGAHAGEDATGHADHQARKEMEAETAAAAARQRQEKADRARAQAEDAKEADAPSSEQEALNKKAEVAAAKAQAAIDNAIAAAEIAGVKVDLEPLDPAAMPRRGLARKADGTPTARTQRNFTDPDSHLMQSGGTFLQGYTCQVAVDSDHQVIVAVGVSNQAPEVEHFEQMLERIASHAGARPDGMTLDAGYWSENNAKTCADQGIDAYIAIGRLPHGKPSPPRRGPLPKDADEKIRMARKLRSKQGSAIYTQRKAILEPVNGLIKEARGM